MAKMTMTHSPNCCCEFCMSKKQEDMGESNESYLEQGISGREVMRDTPYRQSHLTPDYEKEK